MPFSSFEIHEPLALEEGAAKLRESATLQYNAKTKHLQASTSRNIIPLAFGEGSMPLPQSALDAHTAAVRHSGYSPVDGIPLVREAIADNVNVSARLDLVINAPAVKADQILVAPGSKPLLMALFNVLEGDVLVPLPCWVTYISQLKIARKALIPVQTDPKNYHSFDINALDRAYEDAIKRGQNPRIMLINSPHNPTGGMFTRSAIEDMVSWCKSKNVTLISDEIYSETVNNPKALPHVSPRGLWPEGVIVTSGLSKSYSCGGWRVGYVIFPDTPSGRRLQVASKCYASHVWTSAPLPAQYASIPLLSDTEEMRNFRRRAAKLQAIITQRMRTTILSLGLGCTSGDGAFYLMPSFLPFADALRERFNVTNSWELADWLLNHHNISTIPGEAYLSPDPLSLGCALSRCCFRNEEERYALGPTLLEQADGHNAYETLKLPIVDDGIAAWTAAVESLR